MSSTRRDSNGSPRRGSPAPPVSERKSLLYVTDDEDEGPGQRGGYQSMSHQKPNLTQDEEATAKKERCVRGVGLGGVRIGRSGGELVKWNCLGSSDSLAPNLTCIVLFDTMHIDLYIYLRIYMCIYIRIYTYIYLVYCSGAQKARGGSAP